MMVSVVAPDTAVAAALLGVLPAPSDAHVVLVGGAPTREGVSALGVSRVTLVSGVERDAAPDRLGPALRTILEQSDVVILDSSQPSRDLAGWACAVLDAAVVWAVDSVCPAQSSTTAARIVLGGSHRMVHELDGTPVVVLARPAGRASRTPREPAITRLDAVAPASATRVVERASSDERAVALNTARIVVGVGRGIGGPENLPVFRELADKLGAALGASRVVVDEGWLPFAHQVGQTGAAVAPDVYLAFGISGAIQHLAGMRGSRRVVAVNTDTEAPICRVADLVVDADAVDVARALLARLAGR